MSAKLLPLAQYCLINNPLVFPFRPRSQESKGYLSMDEDRIIELEIKQAYQEDLLQALNGIVSQQQQQIDRLERTCALLNERIKSVSEQRQEGENTSHQQEIPPHY